MCAILSEPAITSAVSRDVARINLNFGSDVQVMMDYHTRLCRGKVTIAIF